MALIAGKIKEKSELTAKMAFGQFDLELTLRYLPTAQYLRIEDRSKKDEWDARTHQRSEELDRKKLSRELAKHAVVDWNLTGEMLGSLIDMDQYPSGTIPYSEEDCAALLEGNLDLFRFVRDNCREMSLFDAARRASATKNSSDSPSESSPSKPGKAALSVVANV